VILTIPHLRIEMWGTLIFRCGPPALELDFEENRESEFPFPPIARVYIARSGGVEENSLRYITPDCVSRTEFDHQIDRLIRELENIRARVHKKFDAHPATDSSTAEIGR
jgi:hypothetical protein